MSEGPAPRIGVVSFPGSCDDRDAVRALTLMGAQPVRLWHADESVSGVDGVVIPGGFSYGDYLRCGAIAARSPIMGAVRELAARGAPILGICNGFQVLCEAGLLPGVLQPNHHGRFVCRDVELVVTRDDEPWTGGATAGTTLGVPIKHHDGAWYAPPALATEVADAGLVLLRYADNPNGALHDAAGLRNEDGNVFGLMPHPEHAVDPLLGPTGGRVILEGLLDLAVGVTGSAKPRKSVPGSAKPCLAP